jgi:anhydro-N-acetylmuramic acid kinase
MVYRVIGCMSGTSLDGLDIALCEFVKNAHSWESKIIKAITYNYDYEWKNKLAQAHSLSALEIYKLHVEYGKFIGEKINSFVNNSEYDLIASHGHTVFHTPLENGISLQIGDGSAIYALTHKPVVYNFRQLDVCLGGNGAPLVPVGEKYLYPQYNCFLNLGGIANLSIHNKTKIAGYDVVPCNMVLNFLAQKIGYDFDCDGNIAKNGKFCDELFKKLNELDYYALPYPKSLGREWVNTIFSLFSEFDSRLATADFLNTFCHHISYQIAQQIKGKSIKKIFITGGGAYNKFLLKLLEKNCSNSELILPNKYEIEYKEAKIFAFLGLLRKLNQKNVLKSVTGASQNTISGILVG